MSAFAMWRLLRALPPALLATGLFASAYAEQIVHVGPAFTVNTYTSQSQNRPEVAMAADGSFVVVWSSDGQDGSYDGVFGQRFAPNGDPLGGEFQVSSYTSGSQWYPSVAVHADGSFVVVWGVEDLGTRGQRFASDGLPAGTEFQVLAGGSSAWRDAEVAGLPGGGFVVAWQGTYAAPPGGDGQGIRARIYDSAGAPVTGELSVSGTNLDLQDNALDVAAFSSGDFVVVWESGIGFSGEIIAQRVDGAGVALGPRFTVSTNAYGGSQREPAVATGPSDEFVVAWEGEGPGDDFGAFMRRYDASGTPTTDVLLVNETAPGAHREPTAGFDSDGDILVTFVKSEFGPGVLARRFDSTGAAVGTEFRVNPESTRDVLRPHVADGNSSKSFVVVWEQIELDGSDFAVAAQRLLSESALPLPCAATPDPTPSCRVAGAKRSRVSIRDGASDSKDRLNWSWSDTAGDSVGDFLDPVGAAAGYALCVYDASAASQPLVETRLVPGGVCGDKACWTLLGTTGFRLTDRDRRIDGVGKVKLKATASGKTKISIKAAREGTDPPGVALTTPVTVQLIADDGLGTRECWQATYTNPSRNSADRFDAKSP